MEIQQARNEIEKRQSANYHYLFLSDRPGDIMDKDNCVVHPMKTTWTKNLVKDKEKVLEFISSNPDPGYPYRLGFCRKVRGACDVVQITPGGDPVQVENEVVVESMNNDEMIDPVRTFDQALEDRLKIEKLEYMIRERDRKISELEEELEAMVSDAQDAENGQMADSTVSLINQLAPLLPALADKYFSLQEQKIAAMKGAAGQPQAAPAAENNESTIYQDYGI
tara:strand:- start:693 stop:1361 length:669 start_codon:yes stop_codon:yes gene_type:complete